MAAQIKIFHLIQGFFRGGAVRAMLATAKYGKNHGDYQHSCACLTPWEQEALPIAEEAGVKFLATLDPAVIRGACAEADIVQIEWWNTPQMDAFLRGPLPPLRMATWFHVAGNRDPQYITREIVDFTDIAVATSPQCYESPAFQALSAEERERKTAMVYGPTDFARLANFTPRSHSTFNVGYFGTVDFFKLHPNFVAMSAAAKIPNVRFVVCGGGKEAVLREQAAKIGAEERFIFRGFIEDIKAEIETFDVYGYPLCEETYASSELNLQEVMFCGIPPVVFPYGGVKKLVIDGFTGIVVNSEREYAQALEHLHQNPAERTRLGRNAKLYAEQIFGAENAARKFDPIYRKMLQSPKRERIWGSDPSKPILQQPIRKEDLGIAPKHPGAQRFIESLVDTREIFEASYRGDPLEEAIAAEEQIAAGTVLMRISGLYPYRTIYGQDPFLRFWHGLALFGAGDFSGAVAELSTALQLGIGRTHLLWYIAQAASYAGSVGAAEESLARLSELEPQFTGASEFRAELKRGRSPRPSLRLNEIQF